jgi:hypothetical protein
MSSVSGPYSAIEPYAKPFFPPDPPQMTALYEFFVVSLLYCLVLYHMYVEETNFVAFRPKAMWAKKVQSTRSRKL